MHTAGVWVVCVYLFTQVCALSVHVEDRRTRYPALSFFPTSLEIRIFSESKMGNKSLSLIPHTVDVISMWPHLNFYMDTEDLNPFSHVYTVNDLTH